MKKAKVWVVSEVFYPDTDIATANIATEIALKFSEDFEVHVICGPQDYERKNNQSTAPFFHRIQIHRWNYFNYDKNHRLLRLLRVVGISLGLFLKGFSIKKHDKVFVISNPAFITPLYAFLKKIKKFDYTLLMHDVFPENLIVGGYVEKNSWLYRFTHWLFIRSRRVANRIIVIGRDMKELILQNYPNHKKENIIIVPNWADTETVFPLDIDPASLFNRLTQQRKIVILFAGNHGVLQNLNAFLDIIRQLSSVNMHFVFAGGGATKKELELCARENGLENVTFLPPFPRSEMNRILNSCHIGLVSLKDEVYGVGVPSKSYNILAAGKPILFLGNKQSEIAQFITENDLGWAFEYREKEAIAAFLKTLDSSRVPEIIQKGRNGRNFVEKDYNRQEILNRIKNAIL